jgi:hypothetical protein
MLTLGHNVSMRIGCFLSGEEYSPRNSPSRPVRRTPGFEARWISDGCIATRSRSAGDQLAFGARNGPTTRIRSELITSAVTARLWANSGDAR